MIPIFLLLLNLIGLALAANRLLRDYAMARIWSPVMLVLLCFFVEHVIGLGSLRIAGYAGAAAAIVLIYRDRRVLLENRKVEAAFGGAFLYAFAWRFAFPDLDGTHSEKLTDFTFILNYSRGDRLPPADSWFPPYPFDMYYALQHYAAALAGRFCGVEPGVAYQLGFCTLIALTWTAAWFAASRLCTDKRCLALVLMALITGGTGATLVIHFMKADAYTWDTMRFIGGSATYSQVSTGFANWLLSASGVPVKEALDLPIETFGYLIHLGDYHPPLSGFFLLMAALACIFVIEDRGCWFAHGALAATVPIAAAANSWTVPVQALLIAVWAAYRYGTRKPVQWLAMLSGGALASLLLAPFFFNFVRHSPAQSMAIRLVPWSMHTPALLGLILLAPALVVLAAHFFDPPQPLHRALALFWIACFVLSELVYVDDLYSGKYTRFNTTLKWWGWTYAGALLTTGALNLGSRSRACRWLTIAGLLSSCLFAWDLGRHYFNVPKFHLGRFDGAATIKDDSPQGAIIEYLRQQPVSIVLQRLEAGSYTLAPSVALFAGHNALLGWPDHERVWRGALPQIGARDNEIRLFYHGQMPGSSEWLRANHVDHVLWLKSEQTAPLGTWESIDRELASAFTWIEFARPGELHTGVWSRRR